MKRVELIQNLIRERKESIRIEENWIKEREAEIEASQENISRYKEEIEALESIPRCEILEIRHNGEIIYQKPQTAVNNFHFHADKKTGTFSKDSAQ